MSGYVCEYSIIRYSPFVETEEFANVGILFVCPFLGYFDFKLESRKHKRITDFFTPLKPEVFRSGLGSVRNNLTRIRNSFAFREKHEFQSNFEFLGEKEIRSIFDEITREREGVVQFGGKRIVFCSDPKAELEKLFSHYVDRSFASPEYGEILLENNIKSLLKTKNLDDKFKQFEITDGVYRKKFKFVKETGGKADGLLKPLYLNQRRPTQIIDHGTTWLNAIRRFQKAGVMPENSLFVVESADDSALRQEASQEVFHEFEQSNLNVINISNQRALVEFAKTV